MTGSHYPLFEPGTGEVESPPPAPPSPVPCQRWPAVSAFAWPFSVVDRLGRLTTARVTVNASNLVTVTTSDGAMFGVDPGDQYAEFSAALRQARDLALTNQERKRPPTSHRKRTRR